ncbi:hypothetical protein [Clostridium grantii]|uniref:DUF7852 domain-containing protein n=1 Tax=Clostridium grantii DSM 8605 TaxID=1121316 RepID=A0A1M5XA43_9CLOT|nr:hypothetical protein [Clostridium grantii]SHH96727.1 hypothetical protein SAMN02745207_03489 [Clostridium grantii DSM 8605]
MSTKHKHRRSQGENNEKILFDVVKVEEDTIINECAPKIQDSDNKSNIYDTDSYAELLETQIIPQCFTESSNVVCKDGEFLCKLPVVIAKCDISINIQSIVKFFQPILQVINIENNVILNNYSYERKSHNLFLDGYVRQLIQYATVNKIKKEVINGEIKYSLIYLPFQCTSNAKLENCFESQEKSQGVYCQLISSKVLETAIQEDKIEIQNFIVEENTFDKMNEKIYVSLQINLIQDKFILINKNQHST